MSDDTWADRVARIEAEFEGGHAEALAPLLREARGMALPPIPDPARYLLVVQGLERAERCVEARQMELARTEFRRAVARAEGEHPPVLRWPVPGSTARPSPSGRRGGGDDAA